jgi:hypothetical protein
MALIKTFRSDPPPLPIEEVAEAYRSCNRCAPTLAIPWRRATSEKRESGRIASEVSAVFLLRQTSDDDLARGWGLHHQYVRT